MYIRNGYRQSICASVFTSQMLSTEKESLDFVLFRVFLYFIFNYFHFYFLMEVNHWHQNTFDPRGAQRPPAGAPQSCPSAPVSPTIPGVLHQLGRHCYLYQGKNASICLPKLTQLRKILYLKWYLQCIR